MESNYTSNNCIKEHDILNNIFINTSGMNRTENLYAKLMNTYQEYIKLLGEYIKLKDIGGNGFTEELINTIKRNIFYNFRISGVDNSVYKASVENPAVSFKLINYPIRVNSNTKVYHWGEKNSNDKQPMKYLWITPPIFEYSVDIVGPLIMLNNTTPVELFNVTGTSYIFHRHKDIFEHYMQKDFNPPLAYRFIANVINHNHINSQQSENSDNRPTAGYNGVTNRYIQNYSICVGTHNWKNEFSKFVSINEKFKKQAGEVRGSERENEQINPNVFTVRFLYDLIDWIQICTVDDCYIHTYVKKELKLQQYAEKYLDAGVVYSDNSISSIYDEVSDWKEGDSVFYQRIMSEMYSKIKEFIGFMAEAKEDKSELTEVNNRTNEFYEYIMKLIFDYFSGGAKTILHPGMLTTIFLLYRFHDGWASFIGKKEVCMNIISIMEQALMALLGEFVIMEEFSGRAKRFPLYNLGTYTIGKMSEVLRVYPLITFMDISRKTYYLTLYSPQDIKDILSIYEYYMSYE